MITIAVCLEQTRDWRRCLLIIARCYYHQWASQPTIRRVRFERWRANGIYTQKGLRLFLLQIKVEVESFHWRVQALAEQVFVSISLTKDHSNRVLISDVQRMFPMLIWLSNNIDGSGNTFFVMDYKNISEEFRAIQWYFDLILCRRYVRRVNGSQFGNPLGDWSNQIRCSDKRDPYSRSWFECFWFFVCQVSKDLSNLNKYGSIVSDSVSYFNHDHVRNDAIHFWLFCLSASSNIRHYSVWWEVQGEKESFTFTGTHLLI